jgi:hypothetical protein
MIGNWLSKGHDEQSPMIPFLIFLTIAGYTPSLECCKTTPYLDVHQRDRIWQKQKQSLFDR